MLTTIKGIYNNGNITLAEAPPVQTTTQVIVTFLTEDENSSVKTRTPGGLKGKVTIPEVFNEPLEDLKEYM